MYERESIIHYIKSKGYSPEKLESLSDALSETPSLDELLSGLSLVGIDPIIHQKVKKNEDCLVYQINNNKGGELEKDTVTLTIPPMVASSSNSMFTLVWPAIRSSLFPIFFTGLIIQAILLTFPFSTTFFLDYLPSVYTDNSLIASILLFSASFFAFIIVSVIQSKQLVNLEVKMKESMLYRLTKHYNYYPLSKLSKKPKSYFAQKLQALVKIEEVLASGFLASIISSFSFIASVALLTFMFPMVMVALTLLIIFFGCLATKQSLQGTEKRRWQVSSEMNKNNSILEYMDRFKYITFSDSQSFMRERTAPRIEKDIQNFHGLSKHEISIEWVCEAFKYSAYAVTSSIGLLMYSQGEISLALVFTLLFYQTLLVQSVNVMYQTLFDTMTLRPDWIIIHNFIRKNVTKGSPAKSLQLENMDIEVSTFDLELEREGLFFSYPDMVFEAGKYNVITGPSGCGKSTLLKSILGSITPYKGGIRFNKTCINTENIFAAQQSMISLPQNQTLMYGNIIENVTNWDMEFDWSRYVEALTVVNMLNIVERLDNGHLTHVDHKTDAFSGGEIQRLMLARIIYSKAPIVILDEATSALDSQNEVRIINHLKRSKRTIIAVAHRKESIDLSDKQIKL